MIDLDPRLPRWPTVTITIIVGGFVAIVTGAWVWSHLIGDDAIDDVAIIIAGATIARAVSIGVSVSPGRPACQAAETDQLRTRWIRCRTTVLSTRGSSNQSARDHRPRRLRYFRVRNMSAAGWFNFAAVVVVFGLPGAIFQIQTRQHARRHVGPARYNLIGAVAGILVLFAIGLAIGSA